MTICPGGASAGFAASPAASGVAEDGAAPPGLAPGADAVPGAVVVLEPGALVPAGGVTTRRVSGAAVCGHAGCDNSRTAAAQQPIGLRPREKVIPSPLPFSVADVRIHTGRRDAS